MTTQRRGLASISGMHHFTGNETTSSPCASAISGSGEAEKEGGRKIGRYDLTVDGGWRMAGVSRVDLADRLPHVAWFQIGPI